MLILQKLSELTAHRRLTSTIETCHHDDGRTSLELEFLRLATHKKSKFIVNQFHHQLAWFNGSKHIHAQCLLLYGVGEALGNFVVDIGIEQGATNVLESFGYVDLCYFAFTLEYLK